MYNNENDLHQIENSIQDIQYDINKLQRIITTYDIDQYQPEDEDNV